ncbi:RTA1 like protein-domain-containing protein [Sordaria brevicollis]|uniref:RTA1 like protein-domain-containing protein n=1 Tax=Sordaria brevicollis TaxID=83679 RepID=A0AAE0PKL3_SORBR|nr:RTA1 like protein-domain-containing protein [Sordaria brevicollis]
MSDTTTGGSLEQFEFFKYDPSLAANAVFTALFGITAIGHTFLLVKNRTWYFIPFVLGCLFEAVGYIGRIIAAGETPNWTLTPYIIQSLLILLGPALYAASIYMILARLIRMLEAEAYSVVRVNWLTKIFVLGDVLSFMAQGAGGGLLATAKSAKDQDQGNNVVLAGLGIQVAFFGLFIITTILFHLRIAANPTAKSYSVTVPWRQFLWALYTTSSLIMIRSLFRMVEYAMGWDSVLLKKEVYLLVLDGLLMVIVSVTFLWYHPSKILVGYKQVGMRSVGDLEGSSTVEGEYSMTSYGGGQRSPAADSGHLKAYDSSHSRSEQDRRNSLMLGQGKQHRHSPSSDDVSSYTPLRR